MPTSFLLSWTTAEQVIFYHLGSSWFRLNWIGDYLNIELNHYSDLKYHAVLQTSIEPVPFWFPQVEVRNAYEHP